MLQWKSSELPARLDSFGPSGGHGEHTWTSIVHVRGRGWIQHYPHPHRIHQSTSRRHRPALGENGYMDEAVNLAVNWVEAHCPFNASGSKGEDAGAHHRCARNRPRQCACTVTRQAAGDERLGGRLWALVPVLTMTNSTAAGARMMDMPHSPRYAINVLREQESPPALHDLDSAAKKAEVMTCRHMSNTSRRRSGHRPRGLPRLGCREL